MKMTHNTIDLDHSVCGDNDTSEESHDEGSETDGATIPDDSVATNAGDKTLDICLPTVTNINKHVCLRTE